MDYGISAAINGLTSLLKSKWFWLAIAAIIVFVIIKRNLYKFEKFTQAKDIDYIRDSAGNIVDLDASRKKELENIAQDMYNEINSVQSSGWRLFAPWTANEIYKTVSIMNDQELRYLAQYYKKVLSKNESTLYNDINNELLPQIEYDDTIIMKLKKIGEY